MTSRREDEYNHPDIAIRIDTSYKHYCHECVNGLKKALEINNRKEFEEQLHLILSNLLR